MLSCSVQVWFRVRGILLFERLTHPNNTKPHSWIHSWLSPITFALKPTSNRLDVIFHIMICNDCIKSSAFIVVVRKEEKGKKREKKEEDTHTHTHTHTQTHTHTRWR